MAERVELTAQKRAVVGKQVRQLRRQGWVPAVMYGHNYEAQPLLIEATALRHVLGRVSGSQLISVRVSGQEEAETALIRAIQRNPITGRTQHIDLYRVLMTERITAQVPLVLAGESPAMENDLGILMHALTEIEVECLPGDLPDEIQVDMARLVNVDDAIYVRDLVVPAGVQIRTPEDEMIARILPPTREEVEAAPAAEAQAGEVEVVSGRRPEAGEARESEEE